VTKNWWTCRKLSRFMAMILRESASHTVCSSPDCARHTHQPAHTGIGSCAHGTRARGGAAASRAGRLTRTPTTVAGCPKGLVERR